ncbi:L,D-transpeptidase family protein [Knoellia sp. CPCC 206435]|uniref:L,D-transpeptidase family protein n=1 Tax=Knoellia terrae TaxID=3404797 RepID=UPI003B43CAAD
MAASTRRRCVTAAVAAVLTGVLTACAGVSWTPDGATAAGLGGSGPQSSRSVPTALPSPDASTTSNPTIAPAPVRPTPATTPTHPPLPTPSTPRARTTPTPRTKPTPTSRPKPKPSVTSSPKPTRSAPLVHEDLRPGDRGPEVLAVQKRLSTLGYWMGEPDGHFGSLTQQAVWALQKSAGISRDGTVGPRTQRALDDGVRPRTRLAGDGVDVDVDRQILMVVRGGEVRYTLNTSTGGGYEYVQKDGDTVVARTPRGTFRVGYTVDGRDEGFLGEMWRPRYFNGGYAVHGSPSIPPYPASHGCARVSNAAMNMIWAQDHMPVGSTVLVR